MGRSSNWVWLVKRKNMKVPDQFSKVNHHKMGKNANSSVLNWSSTLVIGYPTFVMKVCTNFGLRKELWFLVIQKIAQPRFINFLIKPKYQLQAMFEFSGGNRIASPYIPIKQHKSQNHQVMCGIPLEPYHWKVSKYFFIRYPFYAFQVYKL